MSHSFHIETEWYNIAANDPNIAPDEESHTTCWLKILANNVPLTRSIDRESKNVRDAILVSAYPLAMWFCVSWWRLLYESIPFVDRPLPIDWRLAHDLPSAASGYTWPFIRFISDEKNINICSFRQDDGEVRIQPMIYLSSDKKVIEKNAVKKGLFNFLSNVVDNMNEYNESSELCSLWKQLKIEIEDEDFSTYRIIEAILGFDPDQAPDGLMKQLDRLSKRFDTSTLREIASIINCFKVDDQLNSLRSIEKMSKEGIKGQFQLPRFETEQYDKRFAWDYGRELARALRNKIGLDVSKKVETNQLCDFFGISRVDFKNKAASDNFSICSRTGDKMLINFRKESSINYQTGRRFHLARLAGACLAANDQVQWFPISASKTWMQKMQRAFAVEFLSPIESVRERLGDNYSDEKISKVAKHFSVSPMTILHSLVNHGDIPRNNLACAN